MATPAGMPKGPWGVLITGATGGIGSALSHALAARGAALLLHGRSRVPLVALGQECLDAGASEVHMVLGDLRDPSLGPRLQAKVDASSFDLDLLVLNAGVLGKMAPILTLQDDALREVIDLDVVRQLPLLRALVPGMLARPQGVVLFMTSFLGHNGLPDYGGYAAAKHGLEGLMKVLAAEHADDGLLSVAVAPGMVQTRMLRAALGTDDVREWQTPEETAQAFMKLLGDLGPQHSGATLELAPWLESSP